MSSWQQELLENQYQDLYQKVAKASESDKSSQDATLKYIAALEEQVSLLKSENAQLKQDLVNAAMGIFRTASFE